VSRSQRRRDFAPAVLGKWAALPIVAGLILSAAHSCLASPIPVTNFAELEVQERPQPVPASRLDRMTKTIRVPRDRPPFMVDTSLQPRDKQGAWLLDSTFKPLRIRMVEIPGKGRRQIHYI
jgi:hypothetical protein